MSRCPHPLIALRCEGATIAPADHHRPRRGSLPFTGVAPGGPAVSPAFQSLADPWPIPGRSLARRRRGGSSLKARSRRRPAIGYPQAARLRVRLLVEPLRALGREPLRDEDDELSAAASPAGALDAAAQCFHQIDDVGGRLHRLFVRNGLPGRLPPHELPELGFEFILELRGLEVPRLAVELALLSRMWEARLSISLGILGVPPSARDPSRHAPHNRNAGWLRA